MFGRKNGNANGATKTKTRACHVIDLSKAPYMSFGAGVTKGNPKRCLTCGQPIKKGESWRKYTSEEDPQYGRYSIIVHSDCARPQH